MADRNTAAGHTRRLRSRSAILQAARELLAERGDPKLVRLDDISERSGRSVQTILNIWPRSSGGKNALFAELSEKRSDRDPHAMTDDELLSAATSVRSVHTEDDLALVLAAAERFERRIPTVAMDLWRSAAWADFVEPPQRLGFALRELALAEASEDAEKIATARLQYAYRLRDCGNDRRADEICERVYEDLHTSEEPKLIEACYWAAQNIGERASWRDEAGLALRWFQSAIEQARRIDSLPGAWVDAAMAARRLGLTEDARRFMSDETAGAASKVPWWRRAHRALICDEAAMARFYLAFEPSVLVDVDEALVAAEAEMLTGRLASAINILDRTAEFVDDRAPRAVSESDRRMINLYQRRIAELREQVLARPPCDVPIPERIVSGATAAMKRLLKAANGGQTVTAENSEELVALAMLVVGHFAATPDRLEEPVFP